MLKFKLLLNLEKKSFNIKPREKVAEKRINHYGSFSNLPHPSTGSVKCKCWYLVSGHTCTSLNAGGSFAGLLNTCCCKCCRLFMSIECVL